MFLRKITADNFRTLSDFSLSFEDHYTAVCGKNNSGKTNVVKALRFLLAEDGSYFWEDDSAIHFKRDRIAWATNSGKSPIRIFVEIELDPTTDLGLIEFIAKFAPPPTTQASDKAQPVLIRVAVTLGPAPGKEKYEVFVETVALDEFSSQELVKKLRSSSACVYHNSTSVMRQRYTPGSRISLSASLPAERQKKLLDKQTALTNEIDRCLEQHRAEIGKMMGRLSERYDVTLNVPTLAVDQLSFGISLGDKGYQVPLDEWGSGTRNRTLILRTLFEARQAATAKTLSDRLTPIVVIEEPESFLHPSAQAEFGSVLQELANEFKIQLIVTSHSPYMLSHRNPNANVLLSRKTTSRKSKGKLTVRVAETQRVPTTGTDWKQPFEHALGVAGPEFEYLKQAIFSSAKEIMLVEGPTDKEYFEDLLDPAHGTHALIIRGPVVSYDGAGNLTNGALAKFVLGLFRVPVVTYDLDKDGELAKKLEGIGLCRDKHFFAVGKDASGQRMIEGLLPPSIISGVSSDNPEVVMAMSSNVTDERKKAVGRFKQLCRERFKAEAKPQTDAFAEFYKLVKRINKAVAERRAGST